MAMVSIDEPPYLSIGTEVSAKCKGAFCEAKITDINKHVRLRVSFEGCGGKLLIDDTEVKNNPKLEIGELIEAKHPEKRKQTYMPATITKIYDHRAKHFAGSETLDRLPLTKPEHFSNPVKVETMEQSDADKCISSKAQSKQQSQSDRSRKKSSTNAPLKIDKEETKSDDIGTETVASRKRQKPFHDDDKIKETKKSRSSLKLSETPDDTICKVRKYVKKKKDSKMDGMDYTDLKISSDSQDLEPTNNNQDDTTFVYSLLDIGDKLMVKYGKGKVQNIYEAKINKIDTNSVGKTRYHVHYTGWNTRYDEWITQNRISSIVIKKDNGSKDGSVQVEGSPIALTNASASGKPMLPSAAKSSSSSPASSSLSSPPTYPISNSIRAAPKRSNQIAKSLSPVDANLTSSTQALESTLSSQPVLEPDCKPILGPEQLSTQPASSSLTQDHLESKTIVKSPELANNSMAKAKATLANQRSADIVSSSANEIEENESKITLETDSLKTKETLGVNPKKGLYSPVINLPSTSTSELDPMSTVSTTTPEAAPTPTLNPAKSSPTTSISSSYFSSQSSTPNTSTSNTTYSSAPATKSYRKKHNKFYAFDSEKRSKLIYSFYDKIDEPDNDKKLALLQERIMALRQTYLSLKSEFNHLEKRRCTTTRTTA